MIDFLLGVDGGGTGTRVRLARADGTEIAQGASGPSGLSLGIARAWDAVQQASAAAFATAGIEQPSLNLIAIGLGLAGVHNKQWAAEFVAANPGYALVRLETDGFTTLMGAHGGAPGAIVAIGTGSVGEVLRADGSRHEVGGWGFPAGDEASGGWIGLRAINHIEQVLDGRREPSAFADSIIEACGGRRDAGRRDAGRRDAIQVWLGKATQTAYASLAPLVLKYGSTKHGSTEAGDPVARAILLDAGSEVANIAHALDPEGTLPLALCGGLGAALRDYLPSGLLARTLAPQGDSAAGALRMITKEIQ
jgi:glucosamine kinase